MIERFASVSSTQDLLHQRAQAGAPAGTVVVAATQTGGRGTHGRRWVSAEGGLWLSYLARPEWKTPPPLSIRIGLELAETISALVGAEIAVKWPNDLLLEGGKVGGVLTEARWQGGRLGWLVVGVGLNVTNPAPELPGVAVSRLADVRPDLTPDLLVAPVMSAIERALGRGEGELAAEEIARFDARDWLKGRPVDGTDAVGAGLAPGGQLLAERPTGELLTLHNPNWQQDLATLPAPA